MHTDEWREPILGLVTEIVEPTTVLDAEPDAVADGAFTELIEGEVVAHPPRPSSVPVKWLIPIGLLSLVVTLIGTLVIVPLFTQSTIIRITPDSQRITATGEITLAARTLLYKTMVRSEQVITTGTAQQAATAAHGWITFYNALQAPQTIPAGRCSLALMAYTLRPIAMHIYQAAPW